MFYVLCLQIMKSNIRPQAKWVISLVIVDIHFDLALRGLCEYMWINMLTLSSPRVELLVNQTRNAYILYLKIIWQLTCGSPYNSPEPPILASFEPFGFRNIFQVDVVACRLYTYQTKHVLLYLLVQSNKQEKV